jgi:hypothetical protein
MLAGPGWARQPARRAVSALERPGTVPLFVEPGPGPAWAQGAERRGAGCVPGEHPQAAALCARGATWMRTGLQGRTNLKKAMYCKARAECPTGGLPARNRVDRAEEQATAWIDCCHGCKYMRMLYTAGF